MPIRISAELPAYKTLENENIFVIAKDRAEHQDIRPLKVIILNIMPKKIETECQLMRLLSNTPLQVDIDLLYMSSHISKNTSINHLEYFYKTFDEEKDHYFDGIINTGETLDFVDYEDVEYWDEVCMIMEWSKKHAHCTFHLCWGAFAGLYYHYGIRKRDRIPKLSGIYSHHILNKRSPLFRGFDDIFYAPHSRATEITREQILAQPQLELMAESDEAGVAVVKSEDSRQFFVLCHSEYDADTLKLEYLRDLAKGMNPQVPVNYFPDDNPEKEPIVNWRSAGQLLWTNWINYYVYQTTPYDINEVENE